MDRVIDEFSHDLLDYYDNIRLGKVPTENTTCKLTTSLLSNNSIKLRLVSPKNEIFESVITQDRFNHRRYAIDMYNLLRYGHPPTVKRNILDYSISKAFIDDFIQLNPVEVSENELTLIIHQSDCQEQSEIEEVRTRSPSLERGAVMIVQKSTNGSDIKPSCISLNGRVTSKSLPTLSMLGDKINSDVVRSHNERSLTDSPTLIKRDLIKDRSITYHDDGVDITIRLISDSNEYLKIELCKGLYRHILILDQDLLSSSRKMLVQPTMFQDKTLKKLYEKLEKNQLKNWSIIGDTAFCTIEGIKFNFNSVRRDEIDRNEETRLLKEKIDEYNRRIQEIKEKKKLLLEKKKRLQSVLDEGSKNLAYV